MMQKIKKLWNKGARWLEHRDKYQEDEENLFIDVLYTKGVEDYAFNGEKNEHLYENSPHYRKGWDDFEDYQDEVRPKGRIDSLAFLNEYVTGVSSAYVHGELFYAERKTQRERNEFLEKMEKEEGIDTKGQKPTFIKYVATRHMEAGFSNAMAVMNKQSKLLKTDETTKKIKDCHELTTKKFGRRSNDETGSVYKVGEIEVDDGTG